MKIIKKYANLKNKMNQIKSIIISSSIVQIKERIFDSITNQLISIQYQGTKEPICPNKLLSQTDFPLDTTDTIF